MQIRIRRVYEIPGSDDGYRVLVDRLWPRGVRKEQACIDASWKNIAPSTELRKWFDHEPARWHLFRDRYNNELQSKQDLLLDLLAPAGNGPLTLVYGAKDERHNHAVVLKEYLEARILPLRAK